MDTRAWFGGVLFSLAPCATLAHAMTQGEPSATEHVTLEGFVLAPDGSPAEGAMVTSSAGGRAVTDVAGLFRLEVDVPLEVTSVQVTARGSAGRSSIASASVALSASMLSPPPITLAFAGSPSCSPSWVPTFGGRPGTDGYVSALAAFDDGRGPALYAGGNFTHAGNAQASRIARWDGSSWSAVGGGMNDDVYALAVYDDGHGPALYAAGDFTTAGGVTVGHVARWDGTSWTALASGLNAHAADLAVYDDGRGPALYVSGGFTTAGGVPASHIARWNGSSWTGLGSRANDFFGALTVFDDGRGPALCAVHVVLDSPLAGDIARWDGSSWTTFGSGIDGVYDLAAYDDGRGPALYAGGYFRTASGARDVAKWNGSSWARLGSHMVDGEDMVFALAVCDDGTGPALYVAGNFRAQDAVTEGIARWNGSSWSGVGSGIGAGVYADVHALAEYDDGSGPAVCAGGSFEHAGQAAVSNVAKWNGSRWSALGRGVAGAVEVLASHDDGRGPALYAAGYDFATTTAGGAPVHSIARWDGSSWSAMNGALSPHEVRALVVYDDGGGPALYAGGFFGVEKWDGTSWSPLGSGVSGISALATYDDGRGPALYAGGGFTTLGGVAANNIARWDGSSWSALGGGVNLRVSALAVYDDGSGPALYAVNENEIARWNGSSWATVGAVLNNSVATLAVYDDGSGPALYAGGLFTTASGAAASHIARWDGSRWTALGSGVEGGIFVTVASLAVYDDGNGPALYVGGSFTTAGGVAVNNVARWDGSLWSALGSGLGGFNATALALAVHDDGSGPALFAGGGFTIVDSGDSCLAKWGYGKDTDPPTLSCPSSVVVTDVLGSPPGEIVTFSVSARDCRDPAPSVVCVPPSGSLFPRGTTLVTCTATDASGNQATCQFPVTVMPKARR
jgi:hypothetical protein